MLKLETLMEPVSEEKPAGEDLCYDPERQQIEEAFESGGDDEVGVDWRATVQRILDQSARTKDVWLAVYLARAGARMGKLETVQDGCAYLAALFETYWDTMHPSLEEYGFQGRKGPCESLTRIGEFLGPLRRTPVVVHPRLGSFTGEDLERFAQQGDSADGYGMFRAAIQAVPEEELKETLERIDAIRDSIRRVDEILTRHADGDTATNFLSTYQALDGVRRGLAPFVGEQVIEIVEEVSPEPPLGLQPVAGATPTVAGRPESRDDVIRSLDAIIDYYRRREPASPVPVALARAKRWVSMDFLAVLQDIAPESLGDARKVLVSGNDTSNDDDNY